jgi:hypothetical protein
MTITGTGTDRVYVFGANTNAPSAFPSPVAWYTMDDNAASTDVIDLMSVYNGTAYANTDTKTTTGVLNGALTFDGTADVVTLGTNRYYSTNFTVSMFVKIAGWSWGFSDWFYNDGGGYDGSELFYMTTNDDTLVAGLGDVFIASDKIPVNVWTMVTATFDNGLLKLYRDGTLVNTITSMYTTVGSTTVSKELGAFTAASAYFNGAIDDVKIFDVTLTAEQIAAMWATYSYTPPATVLLGFDYNYYDANMVASISFTSAVFVAGAEYYALLPYVQSGPRYTPYEWYTAGNSRVETYSVAPSSPEVVHHYFYDNGTAYGLLVFKYENGASDTQMPLWQNWPYGAGDYGNQGFPADPTYEGYTFGGWYTEPSGAGTRIYATDICYTATYVPLYAYWIPNPVTVSFSYNYHDANMKASIDFATAQFNPGIAYGQQNTVFPSVYSSGPRYVTDAGTWYDYNDYTVPYYSTVPTGDHTLHIHFYDTGSSMYLASFDLSQAGVGQIPGVPLFENWAFDSGDYGSGAFPADPSNSDWVFSGWFTSPNGVGTQVSSGDTYYNSTYGSYITLYAYWKFMLYFDMQGGGTTSPTYLTDGQSFGYHGGFDDAPVWTGYTFGGWWTSPGGSGTQVISTDTFSYWTYWGSVTLYAYWY